MAPSRRRRPAIVMEIAMGLGFAMLLLCPAGLSTPNPSTARSNAQMKEKPSAQDEDISAKEPAHEQPEIELTLHSFVWMEQGDKPVRVPHVALDASVADGLGDGDYRLLADFDYGAVRLWQEPPLPGSPRRPLVPLGLCQGEHSVSAWAFDSSGVPFASATTSFVIDNRSGDADCAIKSELTENLPSEATNAAKAGHPNSGEVETCSGTEKQPSVLAGREDTGQQLCRVCPRSIEGVVVRDTSVVFPRPPRKRLLLSTSLTASFSGEGGQGQTTTQEWPIELRTGDSTASAAREFVATRLGLTMWPRRTAPELSPEAIRSGHVDVWKEGEGIWPDAKAVEEERERVGQWMQKKLETEITERQARRNFKRTEAAQIADRTGKLRIIIGSTPGEAIPSGVGWLVTDLNTLDVTDPADFAHLLDQGSGLLVDAFLAEHVWEHLPLEDAHRAAHNCYRHLRPGGRLRLVVPDPAWFAPAAPADPERVFDYHKNTETRTQGHSIGRRRGGDREPSGEQYPAERGSASRDETPLPAWLSGEMLKLDLRDEHFVQFTPDLLANICWSAGFTPVLVEGGGDGRGYGRQASTSVSDGETEVVSSRTAAESSDARDGATSTGIGQVQEVLEAPLDTFRRREPGAGEALRGQELWGKVQKSVAGGDPRGAISIVMDCVKPGNDGHRENPNLEMGAAVSTALSPANNREIKHDSATAKSEVLVSSENPSRHDISGGVDEAATGVGESRSGGPSGDEYAAGSVGGGANIGGGVTSVTASVGEGESTEWASYSSGTTCGGGLGGEYGTHDAAGSGKHESGSCPRHPGPSSNELEDTVKYQPRQGVPGRRQQECPQHMGVEPACRESSGSARRDGVDSSNGVSFESGHTDEVINPPSPLTKNNVRLVPSQGQETRSSEIVQHPRVEEQADPTVSSDRTKPMTGGEHATALAHAIEKRTAHERPFERSPPPPPRVDSGTLSFSDTVDVQARGVHLEGLEGYETSDGKRSDEDYASPYGTPAAMTTAVVGQAAGKVPHFGKRSNVRNALSLHEWAAAARKRGLVYAPAVVNNMPHTDVDDLTSPPKSPIDKQAAAETSTSTDDPATAMNDLASARDMAYRALYAGNVTDTLRLCDAALRESPSDAPTLLYQGAAMTQAGDWNAGWRIMERVLALSCGAEQNAAVVRTTTGAHQKEGHEETAAAPQVVDVSLDVALAAVGNLASFARWRESETLDPNAEMLFLVEGLRGAAEREIWATGAGARGAQKRDPRAGAARSASDKVQDNAGKMDGLANLLIMAAQAQEEKENLTSAMRLYQRVILMGRHDDKRAIYGLGKVSRRLLHVEREKRLGYLYNPSELGKRSALGDNQIHASQPASGQGCTWSIVQPRPGQIFSPGEVIPVEFDLSLLDPGPPSAGSLFETTYYTGDGGLRNPPTSVEEHTRPKDIGGGERGMYDGLGVIVCSYLEGHDGVNCLRTVRMLNVKTGWHVLTAEAYLLPNLTPFVCHGGRGGDNSHSLQTVRFCVGETATCETGGEEHAVPGVQTSVGSTQHAPLSSDSQTLSSSSRESFGEPEAPIEEPAAAAEAELPFCFMTLALNAMPFITHHHPVFREVGEILSKRATDAAAIPSTACTHDSDHVDTADAANGAKLSPVAPPPDAFWEWHVVEGVAAGRADHKNPYSRRTIPESYSDPVTGLSTDGTTEYLDDIVRSDAVESPHLVRPRLHVHRRCGERQVQQAHSVEPGARAGGVGKGDKNASVPPSGDIPVGESDGTSSCLWLDKIQMVNTAAFSLQRECLLVQIDSDELWTATQLVELRDMFLDERASAREQGGAQVKDGENTGTTSDSDNSEHGPASDGVESDPSTLTEIQDSRMDRRRAVPQDPTQVGQESGDENIGDGATYQQQNSRGGEGHGQRNQRGRKRECAYFDCHFFVGPDLITVTEDGWGHSTAHEWLRAWIFHPRESIWLQHAPPDLGRVAEKNGWRLLAGDACIGREETRRRGLVFTHYAYVLEDQVRFKSYFYGHADEAPMVSSSGQLISEVAAGNTSNLADAVMEWQALQEVSPPFRLADHLTWLRVRGRDSDPRLLTTVADRPGSGVRPSSYRGAWGAQDGGGAGEHEPGHAERQASSDYFVPVVPLEPFLRKKRYMEDNPARAESQTVQRKEPQGRRVRRVQRDGVTDERIISPFALTGDLNTRMKETWEARRRRVRSKGRGGEAVWGAARGSTGCERMHLVVDGVVFQIDGANPWGIARVWANVLPAMLDRLGEFEGTCLTFLARSLASPPQVVEDAFWGRSDERFSVVHIPPYTRTSGFVADQLVLSWAVRSAGGTAFVSTMYTQPFWATTPNVVRVLLIHDLIPEIAGWDLASGEWAAKRTAVEFASSVVAVSQHAARDFLRVYPPATSSSSSTSSSSTDSMNAGSHGASVNFDLSASRPVWAAHNGVETTVFHPVSDDLAGKDSVNGQKRNVNGDDFRRAAGLEPGTPYVMIVGSRGGYKNAVSAYRALGLASGTSSSRLALVLVGGGPVGPEELEMLHEVEAWVHIGVGSVEGTARAPANRGETPSTRSVGGSRGVAVDDDLLAAGYSGAVALLHLSIAEGFGLTVLEAFACGCPVVATDISPVREIAGLPETAATTARSTRYEFTDSSPRESGRYDRAASPLKGGLVLIDDPTSATQVWTGVRALLAMDAERRAVVSEALVRRASVFDSWQPLADAMIKAAVD